MSRKDTLDKIEGMLGSVPGYLSSMPDDQLELEWSNISWLLSDTELSSRDKALVSFGAASAIHCPY